MKGLFKVLFAVLAFALMTPVISYAHIDYQVIAFVALLVAVYAFIPKTSIPGVTTNGVNMEFWARYIIDRFWKDNQFLSHAYNDDQYVVGGSLVHIPQPGSKPTVVKNRSSYPATAVRRTDTDITYVLDEYTTDPTHITNIDKVEMSYDKMDSVLGDHMSTLSETVAEDLIIKWGATTTAIIPTSGTAIGPVGAQTGNRLGLSPKDLQKAMIKFNTQNVPKDNERYILIDDNMYEFFYDNLSTNQLNALSANVDTKNGIVGKLHGFNIMTRSSVLNCVTSTNAIKALGAAAAATDNLASLVWHKNSVARAMGDVKMFQDKNNPLYYGDIYSALTRMGGRVRRANAEGIALIVQAPSA